MFNLLTRLRFMKKLSHYFYGVIISVLLVGGYPQLTLMEVVLVNFANFGQFREN